MLPSALSQVAAQALYLALMVSAPILLVAAAVGLVSGLLQAATQARDPSLSALPKVAGVGLCLLLLGGWMSSQIVSFTAQLFSALPALVP